jgi:hypothetical protein
MTSPQQKPPPALQIVGGAVDIDLEQPALPSIFQITQCRPPRPGTRDRLQALRHAGNEPPASVVACRHGRHTPPATGRLDGQAAGKECA